jgi:hypothetical protein
MLRCSRGVIKDDRLFPQVRPPDDRNAYHGREPMNDRAPRRAPKNPSSPAVDPQLFALLGQLRRALEKANPEDQAFVLFQLQEIVRRLAG